MGRTIWEKKEAHRAPANNVCASLRCLLADVAVIAMDASHPTRLIHGRRLFSKFESLLMILACALQDALRNTEEGEEEVTMNISGMKSTMPIQKSVGAEA